MYGIISLYGDSIKVPVGVWQYYKQLNDMQEEMENKESIEKLNEKYFEFIIHMLYDGEVYRYDVGEHESIYYIPVYI